MSYFDGISAALSMTLWGFLGLESLRGEVARLGGLAGLGLEHAVLRGIADKLGYDELLALKGALERQAERVFPVETQLRYGGGRENDGVRDGAFLI